MVILSARAYKNISIKTEFAETIEEFIEEHPRLGYRSIAAFLEDASRRRLEDLQASQIEVPPLQKINHDENGVKIKDNTLGRIADIYFKPSGIFCDLDKTDDCKHIDFALCLPSVQKIIRAHRKEGWKLPDV